MTTNNTLRVSSIMLVASFLTLLQLFTPWAATAAKADNTIDIDTIIGRVDATAKIPLYLTNSDQIVAAQFEINLPFSMPSDGVITLTSRSYNLQVSQTKIGTNTYRVLLSSMDNTPIKGNTGIIMRIPMAITDQGKTSYPITISNIVLADKAGNNIATQKSASGVFLIEDDNVPNLIVPEVKLLDTKLAPGENMKVQFAVKNDGKGATMDGWTAKLYLESLTTGEKTYISSYYHSATMTAGETVSQDISVTLPNVVRMDGNVRALVDVIPATGCGELLVDQDDNTGYSNSGTLSKVLTLSRSTGEIYEGYRRNSWDNVITVSLQRSGDCTTNEAFDVTSGVKNLFYLNSSEYVTPTSVVIPKGASSVSINIYAVNDDIVRAKEDDITFSSANGYAPVKIHITRHDDDSNGFTLSPSLKEITEGAQITITAYRGGELTDTLHTTLTCSAASRFEEMPSLTFMPGVKEVKVTVKSIDDEIAQLDKDVTFSASATDYQRATAIVRVNDNDRPQINITVSPSVIGETGGNAATTAIIKRTGLENQSIRIRLSSSRNELYTASNYVEIPAGETYVEVPLGITDNNNVDGSRSATISAAMYMQEDGCLAPQGDKAYSTADVQIIDNESPYLTLSSNASAVGEGSSTTMRVTRTVVSYNQALTVNLKSADSQVTVPSTVTIPSGKSYAEFSVSVAKNYTIADDHIVTIDATATNISQAQYSLRVTDRTLPDATIPQTVGTEETLYSGCPTTLTAVVHNDGTWVMEKGKHITFYYSSSSRLNYYATITPIYTGTIEQDIAVGESKTLTFQNVVLPDMVGSYWIYAKVENDNATAQKEFSYSNNTSPLKQVYVKAPFTCSSIATDKENYLPGDMIHVTGKVVALVKGMLNGQSVRIDADGNSQRSYKTVKINADGSFEADLPVARSAYGIVTVTARAIGQTEASVTTSVNIYNMSLYSKESTTLDCNVDYQKTGKLILRNLSGKSITGITLEESTLPAGMKLTLSDIPSSLKADEYVEINYTINPTLAYSTTEYTSFSLTASCKEGVSTILNFSYKCHATSSNLAFSSTEYPKYTSLTMLKTTLLRETSRTIAIKLTNYGLKETGEITLTLPQDEGSAWAHLLSQEALPSLAPGQSATIRLMMTFPTGTHSGEILSTQLLASPEIGSQRMLTVQATVVGTEYSNLTVNAMDVYSLAKQDYSHIAGANVTLTDKHNSSHVITGTIGQDGSWTTDQITAGTYDMVITASRHKKVTKEFSIGPGDTQQIDVTVPYYAVVTNFQTSQDLETNEYKMESSIDIDYKAPQAIVIPTLAAEGFSCGKDTVDVVISNVGSETAYNPQLSFANYIGGISFEVLNGYPAILNPGETYIARVAYSGPESGKRRYIGIHNMKYTFTAGTTSLSETDEYQQLLGCNVQDPDDPSQLVLPPVIPVDTTRNTTEDTERPSSMPLASLDSSASLTFGTGTNIKTGADLTALLEVKNGSGKDMTKFRFIPVCYDSETDDDLSDLITCREDSVKGFIATAEGRYTLADQTEGMMNLIYNFDSSLFNNGARKVLIGGQLAYFNGAIQSTQSFPLIEVILIPSGKISAMYLVQRNYMADNMETNAAESAKPAEVVMIVSNEGALGNENSDDVIISNDDIDLISNATFKSTAYQSVYAALNGNEGNYDYYSANLGKLTSEGIQTFHFMNVSSEMAHVSSLEGISENAALTDASIYDFEVKNTYNLVRSVSSKHNQDVSDLEETNPENMDYTVKSLAKTNAYLLDMQENEAHTPDGIMLADGSLSTIENVSDSIVATGGAGIYTVSFNTPRNGWVYGEINDPTNGIMMLEKVVRNSDGAVVAAANFWQTDYTVNADYSLINENLLHFADSISGTSETYTLTYVARPNDKLKVVALHAYTKAGVEVKDNSITRAAVASIRVSLNKNAKNIFTNCVSLKVGDQIMDLSGNEDVITRQNDSRMEYIINLKYTEEVMGLHEFTVLTNKLKEYKTNIKGEGTATIRWTQKQGDINDDGMFDIADVNAIIAVICGGTSNSRTDVNGDGMVDIADVNAIIAIICGGE